MKKLLIPKSVFDQIVSSVLATRDGLETGVTLFGTSLAGIPALDQKTTQPDSGCIVLAIAGPGKRATHQPAHYSGDDGYANEIYDALRSAMPGIRWLGELHVHPRGMTWLSGGDRRTVKQILTGDDDTLHPQEFIAGVMQRRNGTVDIYPYHFTRECLEGNGMELLIVDSDAPVVHQARLKGIQNDRPRICTKPEGSRTFVTQAPRHRWLRQWRERLGKYCRKVRHR